MRVTPKIMPALIAVLWMHAAPAQAVGRNQYHIRDNRLMRGQSTATLMAVQVPELAKPGVTDAEAVKTLNHLAEIGANAACVDLHGLSQDGAAISEEGVAALKNIAQLGIARRLGAVCRVFSLNAPASPAYRMAAVQTAAKALKDQNEVVYWIDGPDCAKLVKEFRKRAPKLIVAAQENGDMDIVPLSTGGGRALVRPILCLDEFPLLVVGDEGRRETPGQIHFVWSSEAGVERYVALPMESQPWTPDNSVLTEQERAEGWIALFNGKDFDGLAITGDNQKGFVIKDGAIEWAAAGGGMVRTRDRYANFILRLDWRIEKGGNSGIYLRAPRTGRCSRIGMEFQLMGDSGVEPHPQSTGAIYAVVAPRVNAAKKEGEWNNLEITLNGPIMKAVLNGETVQDISLDESEELRYRLRRGFIGLQDHGRYVAFRNIRIKPLPD